MKIAHQVIGNLRTCTSSCCSHQTMTCHVPDATSYSCKSSSVKRHKDHHCNQCMAFSCSAGLIELNCLWSVATVPASHRGKMIHDSEMILWQDGTACHDLWQCKSCGSTVASFCQGAPLCILGSWHTAAAHGSCSLQVSQLLPLAPSFPNHLVL